MIHKKKSDFKKYSHPFIGKEAENFYFMNKNSWKVWQAFVFNPKHTIHGEAWWWDTISFIYQTLESKYVQNILFIFDY